ncbi:MAG: hypothetical protein AB1505_22880 [Candidatus Latescibacterota bacterium]
MKRQDTVPARPLQADTPLEVERLLVEGYRAMSPRQKLERVVAMNQALVTLARARLRAQYGPDLPEREVRLRLGALWLDRDTMVRVFGWDPQERGY